MIKVRKVTITTEYLDESTGELFTDTREYLDDSIKASKKKSTSSKSSSAKIDDSNPIPTLTLEDNKYILNAAAIEALDVEPGDTIDIKNQKIGTKKVKVIGSSMTFGTKAGNKLTQKGTVSFRGKSNDELSEFGNIFILEPHPNVSGLFVLKGNNQEDEEEVIPEEEDTVEVDEEIEDALEISEDDFDFTF